VIKAKRHMERTKWTSFIVLTTLLALVIHLLIINPVLAQGPNTTTAQNRNNTKLIVDLKNNTITLVDKTTNETISVKNLMPKAAANTTITENITTNEKNATTNVNLTPETTTSNDTLTTNTGNATTDVNLTAKFSALQGK
jgi:cytoskeletal protein RodZ